MKKSTPLFLYILLWFVSNLSFLDKYPFMHEDESWLSGLTRQMLFENKGDVTEPFYDLYERHPHGLKILFHKAQALSIKLFGFSLFSVRLLSLCAGSISLLLFYNLLKNQFPSLTGPLANIPLLATIALSVDIQFLYASHFARQEIIMATLMLGALMPLTTSSCHLSGKRGRVILSGGIIGLSLGFHPNAFIIAWPPALFLLTQIIIKKRSLREGCFFLMAAAITGSIFILLSLSFNPRFFHDYFTNGSHLGVRDNLLDKILLFPHFMENIFYQKGGTYYLPPVRGQIIVLPLLLFLSLKKGKEFVWVILTGLAGITLGIALLGKYSSPSILFYLPFFYGSATMAFTNLQERTKNLKKNYMFPFLLVFLLAGGSMLNSIIEIRKEITPIKESYDDYLVKLSIHLPPDSVALGGLSLAFYLERGNLYNWRNLTFLPQKNDAFAEYIHKRGITHIVVPREISFIYENRPQWDVLYGSMDFWYPQMRKFLDESCQLMGEFTSPGYGNRVVAHRFLRDWPVQIYRVVEKDSTIE